MNTTRHTIYLENPKLGKNHGATEKNHYFGRMMRYKMLYKTI